MRVPSMLVRLPDFEYGVIDGLPIAIQHTSADHDLSLRLRGWREIVDVERLESDAEVGAYGLRCSSSEVHVTCPAASHCVRAIRCRSDIPARAPARWCQNQNRPPGGDAPVHWP